jgi:hypothetical protein
MEMKEAVARAKAHVADLFADENITEVGLEEVEYDHEKAQWNITIGFYRGIVGGSNEVYRAIRRTYKTVVLADPSGDLIAVKHRDVVN